MENLPQNVAQSLEILIYISIVLILITGVFLIKLLLDMSNLVKSLQDFIKITQAELEPAIKEIQNTLVNVANISSNASNQVNNINNGLQKGGIFISDSAKEAYKRLQVASLGIKKSLTSAINTFLK